MTHFNPHAYLAQKEKLSDEQIEYNEAHPANATTPRDVYPNMTAIDFKGHNDLDYQLGLNGKWYYAPLLDDDGLLSIQNCDETQNIVVYAPAADANSKTYSVLNSYFTAPVYSEHYDNSKGYRLVAEASAASVHGHLVQSSKTTTNDHLLVDYQDFNAPIAYTLGGDKRMWYQRLPLDKEFVDLTKGWQGISIPFTAELVTTETKGEITHFYSGSNIIEGSEAKIGHEYWLREFNEGGETEGKVYKANFKYPNASGGDKNYTNTFLWDYYYKNTAKHDRKDANDDIYQTYYETAHTHKYYPLLTAAKPYIIGFPGQTYYEFDLSGNFEAKNTAVAIDKLGKQLITFASNPGISIGVSDDEMDGVTKEGYTFKPSYMSQTLKAIRVDANGKRVEGDTTPKSFVINSDGSAYNAVTWNKDTDAKEVTVLPFRPYFIDEAAISSARQTRSILFSQLSSEDMWLQHPQSPQEPGSLSAHAGRRLIAVSSTMNTTVNVHILNTAGQALATFDIEPGETVETRINISGVYVVQSADGSFTKKLAVK